MSPAKARPKLPPLVPQASPEEDVDAAFAKLVPPEPSMEGAQIPPLVKTDLSRTPAPGEMEEIERREHEAQVKAARDQMLREETAEADRIRSLGPQPNGVTEEDLRNNPSNYVPPSEPPDNAPGYDPFANSVVAVNPSIHAETVPAPRVASPPESADTRQRWLCVGSDGIRTGHPAFRSDVHLMGSMVACPECDSQRVRKIEPGEALAEDAVSA